MHLRQMTHKRHQSKLYLDSTVLEVGRRWNKAGKFDRKEQSQSGEHRPFKLKKNISKGK